MTEQQLKAKEFLMQAYHIDIRINSKIDQISSLHDLATKATSTLSDMPGSATRNVHRMEDVILKIIELEEEIHVDMNNLIDLKQCIMQTIKGLKGVDFQTILELRYLCMKQWEQIAVNMGYSLQHIFRLHDKALKEVWEILKEES